MKRTIKILIMTLTLLIVFFTINVKATGYTYNHKGEPIYSTAGLTVNQMPKMAKDLGIDPASFTSPEDMYIYEEEDGTKKIYIVDSSSNKLFVLNDSLTLIEEISSFRVNVSDFSEEQLRLFKSSKEYVVAHDTSFGLPLDIANSQLLLTVEEDEEGNETRTGEEKTFQLQISNEITEEYIVKYSISNSSIVNIEEVEANSEYKITALEYGKATITFSLYYGDEETVNQKIADGQEADYSDSTEISVVSEVTQEEPHFGFTYSELVSRGYFDLHLSGVTSVFRGFDKRRGRDLIYLADKENNQIVVVDSYTYEVVNIVTTPDDSTFDEKSFSPEQVIADSKGRMYVIAANVYEGIMQFSADGKFNRFVGVNYVSLTPWEIFWRNFSTEEQLAKQNTIINTSFTSLTIDSKGFIYTTAYAITDDDGLITDDQNMVKKINQVGKDILRRNGYQAPMGDVLYNQAGTVTSLKGASKFVAIDVNEYGLYTIVDAKMSKLFTYDNEGRLLYISGEPIYSGVDKPSQINTLSNPVSVRYLGENLLVLDKNTKAILIYEPTDIGKIINEASRLDYEGDTDAASQKWQEVVKLNANYEYAYIGIGKDYYAKKDYKSAMKYFELGADNDLYSKAYKMYRDAKIRKYFGPFMLALIVLIVAHSIWKRIKRKGQKREDTGLGDE